ncbi:MAG: AraC family transcriptional regulator [Dyadobacter sp.]|uniref:helix-turn-helix domain-containing protein n=1 Tax=Dyadobacter sp. TaxID=1914288 RepID=UPI001B2D2306|nr:helix-turn-helix domain-containing protein [Dyadobacter sp.]MBO9611349.1 AraC family transcriptional regulator [Dyadobacter sp.]
MYSLLINAATVSCLLFLSILAATKRTQNILGYRFLAALFIGLSFDFTDEVLAAVGTYNRYPWLSVAFQPVLFTFAPIIYWATFYLTSVSQKWSPGIFYHFIPYAVILLLYFKSYVFTDADLKSLSQAAVSAEYNPVDTFLVALFFIQVAIYMYFSIRKLAEHRKTLPLFVSNLPDNDYHWLSNIIAGMCILFAVSFAEAFTDSAHRSGLFPSVYLLGFYYVGLQLVRQRDVFSLLEEPLPQCPDSVSEDEGVVVQKKKTISDEKIALYHQRLLAVMESEKPYMDSEITLPRLAKMILLNTYQTSYLINSQFNENFYNFIHRYRLENCKRMLLDSEFDHLSILDIAFESGFNSKTSFNTAFKKYTGCSPREFRERGRPANGA